jgi:hypothetical protein
LAEALGVPVERFAVGVEDPAGLEADPGPTPTKKVRAGGGATSVTGARD